MAVDVVDLFEPVEIDKKQRQRPAIADGALRLFAKDLVEVARVEELREIVGDRERLRARDAARMRGRLAGGLGEPCQCAGKSRRNTRGPSAARVIEADQSADGVVAGHE